jgi:ssRNA-specific RNase YbeY (16S rRNA maturation enzyme)
VIHGLLHLCGYDDHTTGERRKMRERERYHLGGLASTSPRRRHSARGPRSLGL